MSYCGFSNYQTWVVNLWIYNEEGLSSMIEEACTWNKCLPEYKRRLADFIENMIHNLLEQETPFKFGLFDDMMGYALSEVNWMEIAQNWINLTKD